MFFARTDATAKRISEACPPGQQAAMRAGARRMEVPLLYSPDAQAQRRFFRTATGWQCIRFDV
jgi:hypothetical protein